MELFITLAVFAVFGCIIYQMAETRGRNPWAWVILSVLLSPLLGLIILAICGNTEEKKDENFKALQARNQTYTATVEYK